MLKDIFLKKKSENDKNIKNENNSQINIPDKMWVKCSGCGRMVYDKVMKNNLKVCPICGYHTILTASERRAQIFDKDSLTIFEYDLKVSDPLNFPGYKEKLEVNKEKSGLSDAVICGTGTINSLRTAFCIMDNKFLMGSMGYVVGESITRTIEYATKNNLSVIIFTTSGGARMQEGIISLMQMAKISGALGKHSDAGLLYVSVITHPTTGGVTASFASLGDIIIAESGALFGFAGKRVIEQTIKQKLPKNFQTAQFACEKGFIDKITVRKKLKELLWNILLIHSGGETDE